MKLNTWIKVSGEEGACILVEQRGPMQTHVWLIVWMAALPAAPGTEAPKRLHCVDLLYAGTGGIQPTTNSEEVVARCGEMDVLPIPPSRSWA